MSFSEPLLVAACPSSRRTLGGIRAEAAAAAARREAPVSNRRRVSLEAEGYDESIMREVSFHIVAVQIKNAISLSSGPAERGSPHPFSL
jgi:hypothetical protein